MLTLNNAGPNVLPSNSQSATASILEELLIALMGHTGDIFVDESSGTRSKIADPSACSFVTAKDLRFISAPDRDIMNDLLRLGFHFRELELFVKAEQFGLGRKNRSQYRCALANGIRELLVVYSSAVLRLQQHLRRTPNPSLATLNYFLDEFKVLLPSIHSVAYEVQAGALTGSRILQLLHKRACNGMVDVQSCLDRLAWHCHQVFYKQLKAWVVNGLLVDHGSEFLVQASMLPEAALPRSAGLRGLRAEEASIALEWHRGFEVRPDSLPPGVSHETALSILFIGKAVRVLRPRQGSVLHDQLAAGPPLDALQASPVFDPALFESAIDDVRERAAARLWQLVLVEGELPLHLAALRDYFLMGCGDFWQSFLLESRSLMSMPVIRATAEANLAIPFQQSAGKSSADGDPLFAMLAIKFPADEEGAPGTASTDTVAGGMPLTTGGGLAVPSQASTQASVPVSALGHTSTLTAAPTKDSREKETPSITPQTGDPRAGKGRRNLKVPDYDPTWDPLMLEYQVKWPLHLILTPQVMMRYCRLFQYLFRLKRMQLELELTWAALGGHRDRAEGAGSLATSNPPVASAAAPQPPLWQVRSHMAHFINNLQLYIQVDVIEVQYSKLVGAMQEVKDLKAAESAHEAFLAACIVQSCLDVPMFSTLLSKLLSICKEFCARVQGMHQGGTGMAGLINPYPTRLVDEFHRTSRLIYKLLSTPSMQSRARAPFLRQLLLRLNYNDFVQQDTDRHEASQAPIAKPQ